MDSILTERSLYQTQDDSVSTGEQSPNHLAVTTRDLLTKLGTHMGAQEQVLGTDAEPPSTSALGSSPHTWYEFTNGPLVDLDNLPGPQGVDAALSRMLDFAPANRWTCKPAAIRSPSGGDCRWLTRAATASATYRKAHPSGGSRSSDAPPPDSPGHGAPVGFSWLRAERNAGAAQFDGSLSPEWSSEVNGAWPR